MTASGRLKPIEILLVEDSPTDRLITTDALERSNLLNSLNVVENGVDAMAYLRQEGKFSGAQRPDIILLDLNLPKKDGREVLSELKADPLLKYIPVVVLTTSTSDADLLRAYGAHANGYITKPVDFPRFIASLRALGGYWFEVVTLPPDAAIERLARTEQPSSRASRKFDGSTRILLIEDSPTDVRLFRDALERASTFKFHMELATTLAEAFTKLRSGSFDLIITDLALPDSQGTDTYRRVQREAPDLPVIVLTALEDDASGLTALREGAQDYLVKGELTARALARTVRYAIDKKEYQEKLHHSHRLEVLGRLAAGLAHDFSNILSVVRGNTELLAEARDLSEVAESVIEIREATERAIGLGRQLLTFSQKQVMRLDAVDLNDTVGNFTRMLRRLLGEEIRLELHLGDGLPPIGADVGMIEQVLLNLAINARDAMPSGGKLRINTVSVELSPSEASLYPDGYAGRFVQLCVADTGAGMEPDLITKIFDPFFTTKRAGEGTGIGLSTVHAVVQQHRGWIHVASRVGFGTTFEVFLPVSNVTPTPEVPVTPTKRVAASGTILLVEDEPALRHLTARVLRRAGYQVLEAGNAHDAIAHWRNDPNLIDMVFTDLDLPEGTTGRQLAEKLKELRPDLRVLFTSGYSPDFEDPTFTLDEGVNLVRKPYPLTHLIATVTKIMPLTELHAGPEQ